MDKSEQKEEIGRNVDRAYPEFLDMVNGSRRTIGGAGFSNEMFDEFAEEIDDEPGLRRRLGADMDLDQFGSGLHLPVSKCTIYVDDRVQQNNWRARRAGAKATLTTREWHKIVERFDGCCAYCGKECQTPIIEHVVPLCRGGDTSRYNIAPSCVTCNLGKSGKEPLEWMIKMGTLEQFIERAIGVKTLNGGDQ